jgi:ESCRT-II complex subunit VPS22
MLAGRRYARLTLSVMRKGAGISGLSRHTAATSSYASLSTSISASQLTSLETSLASFREALLTFSRQHRDDIRADPAFRHQFTKMCSVLGVDPLSGPTGRGGGGFWGGLGLGEWSYELCVQVVDVCVSTRAGNGGMIEMNDLIRRVGKMRGLDSAGAGTSIGNGKGKGEVISREDVTRAIGLLKPLAGYSVVPIGGIDFVRSVPRELDTDQSALLVIAATTGGRLTESRIRRELGWNDVRARQALEDSVMREGLGWVDEQDSERGVWLIASVEFEGQGLGGL